MTQAGQLTSVVRPRVTTTASMRATALTFTASRNAALHGDHRSLGRMGLRRTTRRNDGRKTAPAAIAAPPRADRPAFAETT